jgi:hypothetical protein
MLISDHLIFLQLQKTACTHIAAELKDRIGGRVIGKHQPLDKCPDGVVIAGSVRNPWDWYVSLWAYGCSGHGAVRNALTRDTVGAALRRSLRKPGELPAELSRASRLSGANRAFWERVYRNPNDPGAFRAWLLRLLTTSVKSDVFEDRRTLPFFKEVGLYTARYAQIFTRLRAWKKQAPHIGTIEALKAYLDTEVFVDRFILMERLEEDLAALLCELGHECTAESLRGEKRNTSKRLAYADYHDGESVALIAKQDRLVASRQGYRAPDNVSSPAKLKI